MNLPELRRGWRYQPLKHVADVRFSSVDKHSLPEEEPVRLCNYLDVYRNEKITEGLDFMTATATKKEKHRFSLRMGDVLMTKDSEDPHDIGVPALVAEALRDVICGYHLALLRPDEKVLFGPFLQRALAAPGIRDQFFSKAVGVTRFALGLSEIGDSVIPLPALDVQRAIAAFLDRKTAAIDALIAKKERLIGLLQEKRQALITSRVLPPTEARWDPTRLGWLLREVRTPVHVEPTATYAEIGVRSHGKGTFHKEPLTGSQLDEKKVFWVVPGALVFNIVFAWERAVAIVTEQDRGRIASHRFPMYVPVADSCDVRFIRFLLLSDFGRFLLDRNSPGAAGRNKTLDRWSLMREEILIPPLAVQRQVADSIERDTAATVALSEKLLLQIQRLKDYRQSLISAAVTGKLDIPIEDAA